MRDDIGEKIITCGFKKRKKGFVVISFRSFEMRNKCRELGRQKTQTGGQE